MFKLPLILIVVSILFLSLSQYNYVYSQVLQVLHDDIAINPDLNTVYVTNTGSDTVSVISGENNTKLIDIPIGN